MWTYRVNTALRCTTSPPHNPPHLEVGFHADLARPGLQLGNALRSVLRIC
jgi:hypothetical protein